MVDEAQDFGTAELTIIRKLTQPKENDIFLCGDAAQQVNPKAEFLTFWYQCKRTIVFSQKKLPK